MDQGREEYKAAAIAALPSTENRSDGEVSGDSNYTSNPVEANKVHVERAKRRRAKAPCVQPLVLTRRQQPIANAIV